MFQHLSIDFVDQPDLAQTFAVTCCLKGIPFNFNGLQSLKIKETDRNCRTNKRTSQAWFVLSEPAEGQLAWSGERCEQAEIISIATYEDHRMAMAFAPAALVTPLSVEYPEVVSKSYPNFWKDFELLTL